MRGVIAVKKVLKDFYNAKTKLTKAIELCEFDIEGAQQKIQELNKFKLLNQASATQAEATIQILNKLLGEDNDQTTPNK